MIQRCKILASSGHLDLYEMKKLIKKINKNWFKGVVWKWYEGEYEPSRNRIENFGIFHGSGKRDFSGEQNVKLNQMLIIL
jgi:hypothetical protein